MKSLSDAVGYYVMSLYKAGKLYILQTLYTEDPDLKYVCVVSSTDKNIQYFHLVYPWKYKVMAPFQFAEHDAVEIKGEI